MGAAHQGRDPFPTMFRFEIEALSVRKSGGFGIERSFAGIWAKIIPASLVYVARTETSEFSSAQLAPQSRTSSFHSQSLEDGYLKSVRMSLPPFETAGCAACSQSSEDPINLEVLKTRLRQRRAWRNTGDETILLLLNQLTCRPTLNWDMLLN
jgi:hypothetical protein